MDKKQINKYLICLQNGNINALDKIYELTKKAVFSVSLSIVNNYDEAQDLMHNTYLKINEKIHLYKKDTNGLAWILTITKNISINQSKKLARNVVTDFNDNEYLIQDVDRTDNAPIFKVCKQVLTKDELIVVLLHCVSGYKHREIAELINKPLGTVLWIYNNSLKKLKKNLGFKDER